MYSAGNREIFRANSREFARIRTNSREFARFLDFWTNSRKFWYANLREFYENSREFKRFRDFWKNFRENGQNSSRSFFGLNQPRITANFNFFDFRANSREFSRIRTNSREFTIIRANSRKFARIHDKFSLFLFL